MATVTLTEYCTVDDTKARLERVLIILNALEEAMIDDTIDFGRSGYRFDDGQTKVETTFKSMDEISKAYAHWVKVANLLKMQCQGGGIFTAREMNFRCRY